MEAIRPATVRSGAPGRQSPPSSRALGAGVGRDGRQSRPCAAATWSARDPKTGFADAGSTIDAELNDTAVTFPVRALPLSWPEKHALGRDPQEVTSVCLPLGEISILSNVFMRITQADLPVKC
jgi:hypothetical protein